MKYIWEADDITKGKTVKSSRYNNNKEMIVSVYQNNSYLGWGLIDEYQTVFVIGNGFELVDFLNSHKYVPALDAASK